MPWEWPVGALFAFCLALVTTPAGLSGAVLLLPVQVSVLGVASPAVTPTNLLYNIFSTPGAPTRFARRSCSSATAAQSRQTGHSACSSAAAASPEATAAPASSNDYPSAPCDACSESSPASSRHATSRPALNHNQ